MTAPSRTEIIGAAPRAQAALIAQIAISPVMVFETIPIQSLIFPLRDKITSSRFSRLKPIIATNSVATKAASDSMSKD